MQQHSMDICSYGFTMWISGHWGKTPLDKVLTNTEFSWEIWLKSIAMWQQSIYTYECHLMIPWWTLIWKCLDKCLTDA
jgi:hypothetical protein